MTRLTKVIIGTLLVASFALSPVASSDEVEKNLSLAQEMYQKKQYKQLSNLLNKTVALLREKRKEKLKTFLPAPPSGYEFTFIETPPMPAFMEGLGLQVDGKYTKSGQETSVSIMLDSPLNASTMAFLQDPEKRKQFSQIKDYRWGNYSGTFQENEVGREISLLVGDNLMIMVRSKAAPKADMEKLLKSVDVNALSGAFKAN